MLQSRISTTNSSPPKRDGVAPRQRLGQPLGHLLQHGVARFVAERIVDQLEAVEIDEQHRDLFLRELGFRERLLKQLRKKCAVRQPGQLVVMRKVADALLGPFSFGDVAHDARVLGAAVDAHFAERELDRKYAAVPALALDLARNVDGETVAASLGVGPRGRAGIAVARQHQAVDVAPDQFERLPAEHALDCGVDEFQHAGVVDHDDAVGSGINDRIEQRFARAQVGFGQALRVPHFGVGQLAAHHRHQAADIVFHHVVVGARLHREHGGFLAHSTRHQDERDVEPAAGHHGECCEPVELRHRIVGNHHVPRLALERRDHGFRSANPFMDWRIAAAAQGFDDQIDIFFAIIDAQQFQRSRVAGYGAALRAN